MSTTMTRDRARRIDALFSRMVAAEEAIRRDFRDRAIIERRLAAARPDCPLLFYRLRKGKPVRIYEFRKAWASACKAVGLTGKLFHDFRRTGVRNLVRAGVPRKTAATAQKPSSSATTSPTTPTWPRPWISSSPTSSGSRACRPSWCR